MAPLISCVVPVFNGERFLREALDSILAQTYRPVEIIVADDGSTDGTAGVVAANAGQIRYLWQRNAGPAAARNLGLSVAQGEFVAFLDADDLWHREKLARQMACFQARSELDLCVTHIQNFWVPELRREAIRLQHHRLMQALPGYLTPTLLARRAVFEWAGGFDVALPHAGDTEWFLRAAERGAVMELLPDVLTYRRLHQTNRSRLLATASWEEYLLIVKASLDRRRRLNRAAAPYAFPGVDEPRNT
jgi:glycosyltransferase involved in cell wall biosynthesis